MKKQQAVCSTRSWHMWWTEGKKDGMRGVYQNIGDVPRAYREAYNSGHAYGTLSLRWGTMSCVHAEIEYTKPDGTHVHSDVCPAKCSAAGLFSPEYRKFLHEVLDEWLNNSNGTGGFYIKSESHSFD